MWRNGKRSGLKIHGLKTYGFDSRLRHMNVRELVDELMTMDADLTVYISDTENGYEEVKRAFEFHDHHPYIDQGVVITQWERASSIV